MSGTLLEFCDLYWANPSPPKSPSQIPPLGHISTPSLTISFMATIFFLEHSFYPLASPEVCLSPEGVVSSTALSRRQFFLSRVPYLQPSSCSNWIPSIHCCCPPFAKVYILGKTRTVSCFLAETVYRRTYPSAIRLPYQSLFCLDSHCLPSYLEMSRYGWLAHPAFRSRFLENWSLHTNFHAILYQALVPIP